MYIGPYIKVYGASSQLISNHESVLYDGRGELCADKDGAKYLIPNKPIVGLRTISFSENDVTPAVTDMSHLAQEDQRNLFKEAAAAFLRELTETGGTYTLHWGIVVGVF